MDPTIVMAISILMQLTAALLAVRLINITGKWQAWTLIAAAFFLMIVHRCISFYRLISSDLTYKPDLSAELVALSVSVFMVVGLVSIANPFLSMRRSKEALQEAHSELEHSERYFQGLIESSPDAIISKNREGKIIFFSPGAENLLGYRQEEIIGRNAASLYGDEKEDKQLRRQIHKGGGRRSGLEIVLQSKDGNLIPVLVSASLLYDEKGSEIGTVEFVKDLRSRKMNEEELKRVHEELRKTNESLESAQASVLASEKMAALGRLVAGVSHEIMNPLNVITMNMHMMIHDPEAPDKMVKNLRDVDEQAKRVVKLTQNLLYYARKRKPERQQIDFNETIIRTFGLLEHELKLGNIDTNLGLAEELPQILANQDQIQQVVLNLLTNARDAMPNGGRLAINTNAVHEDCNKYVEFRVEDSGPGIPTEDVDRVFEPFFTTKPEGKGTGLGLSICQGIIEAHDGTIWAESEEGNGTTFIIQLPLEESRN